MNHPAFTTVVGLSFCRDGELFLGAHQFRLLQQVHQDGSIRTAAINLKMSYQHAWHLLDRVNRLSPVPVLVRQKGGKDGGGCSISPYGLKLMAAYQKRVADVVRFLEQSERQMDRCFF
jgi:molybdate transport system regulatory protein